MADQISPFSLINAFFIDLRFKRSPETPAASETPLVAEIKIVESELPDRLQANLRIRSAPGTELEFSTEVVGLFGIENQDARENKALQEAHE